MTERIKGLIERLPGSLTALAVAGAAIAGAASAGFAVRGTLGAQMALPGEVAAIEARVDSTLEALGARIDSTNARIGELVDSQDRLTRQMQLLACAIDHERKGVSVLSCEGLTP